MDEITAPHKAFIEAYQATLDIEQAAQKADFPLLWCSDQKPKDFYVYGLIDPINNELFYVGKGKGKRWQTHSTEARGANGGINKRKSERICAIYLEGFTDIPALNLAHGLSESDALKLEAQFIRALHDKLTNSSPWTRSAQWIEKAKAKHLLEAQRLLATDLVRNIQTVRRLKAWAGSKDHDMLFSELESLVTRIGVKRFQNAGTQEPKA